MEENTLLIDESTNFKKQRGRPKKYNYFLSELKEYLESSGLSYEEACVITGVDYPTLKRTIVYKDEEKAREILNKLLFEPINYVYPIKTLNIEKALPCVKFYGDLFLFRRYAYMLNENERMVIYLYNKLTTSNRCIVWSLLKKLQEEKLNIKKAPPRTMWK